MPRPHPPHLHRQVTQHGKVVWYVRVRKGPRTRLKAVYGSEAFWTEYRAAVSGAALPGFASASSAGSLRWLWDRYRETGAWTSAISQATRRQRENIMKHVLAASGTEPYTRVNEASIVAGIEKRSATPSAARNFLDTMSGLFRWAKTAGHVKVDPTAGVKAPKRKKGKGFPAWVRADVEAYCRRWPLGTRQRVWLAVVLFTGLRRGDLAVVGKQHVRDGVITLRTEKGGETITVTLPILPPLQEALNAGPIGDLAWICGARGEPFVPRQCVLRGRARGRRQEITPRCPQDRRHDRGRKRRHRQRAGCDLRMGRRWPHLGDLYRSGRSRPPGACGDGQAQRRRKMMSSVPYYLRGDDPKHAEVNKARLAIGLPLDRFVGMHGGINTGMAIVCRCIHCGTLFGSRSHVLADLDHICRGDCGRSWMHESGTSAPSPGDEVRAAAEISK